MTKSIAILSLFILPLCACGRLSELESVESLTANAPLRAEYLKQCKAAVSSVETQARCMLGVQAEWKAQKDALFARLGDQAPSPEMQKEMKDTFIMSMQKAGIDTTGISALLE